MVLVQGNSLSLLFHSGEDAVLQLLLLDTVQASPFKPEKEKKIRDAWYQMDRVTDDKLMEMDILNLQWFIFIVQIRYY